MLKEKIVLASRSLRRAEILSAVSCPFEVLAANIDESRLPGEEAIDYVRRLATEKAKAVATVVGQGLVLGADTIVVVEGQILGQPRDLEDARRMLKLLSGRWHEVHTGVALLNADAPHESLIDHQTSRVRFAVLSCDEIEWYIATNEPFGKAGAYAIQGRGALFVEAIEGDYFNIVGLPVRRVYELLTNIKG